DIRIIGTVAAIEKYLLKDCFVARYNTESAVDGLPGNEGAFLACSFGSRTTTFFKVGIPTRGVCSSCFLNCATMSGFWRKNMTREPAGRSVTFPRRSRTSL